jgi:glycerophosphoryl diester phosphodiesterase
MLETWRKLELPVHVWTINEPKDMNRLIDLGVDGIMTDDAAQLKSVLGNRELWQS